MSEPNRRPLCVFVNCDQPMHGRGCCRSHYMRCWRGTLPWPTYTPPPVPTPEDRFWAKVDKTRGPGECWPWLGAICANGYGSFDNGLAHRFAHEVAKGPIPQGLVIDHLCGQRYCVNPDHLEAVTTAVNVQRGYLKNVAGVLRRELMAKRTHCIHGHELTPENVYLASEGRRRQCRTCRRNNKRRAQMRKEGEGQCLAPASQET